MTVIKVFRSLLDSLFVLESEIFNDGDDHWVSWIVLSGAQQVGGEYLKPAKSETEQIENGRK